MRNEMRVVRGGEPVTVEEWNRYLCNLAVAAGFREVVRENGHGDIFVREHPAEAGKDRGSVVLGEEFMPRHAEIMRRYPDLFKRFLEHTVIHLVGEVCTAGVVYSGMQGLATMVGAEKLGYSQGELLDLLAAEIVTGYLATRSRGAEDYEAYLRNAESVYDYIFWDFLTKEQVLGVIARARGIWRGMEGIGRFPGRANVKKN